MTDRLIADVTLDPQIAVETSQRQRDRGITASLQRQVAGKAGPRVDCVPAVPPERLVSGRRASAA